MFVEISFNMNCIATYDACHQIDSLYQKYENDMLRAELLLIVLYI